MPSSSQNHPGARPDRLLILPFTRRKFYASVSSSRVSTNGIALRPESRRYRVCTASVRIIGVCVGGFLSNLEYFGFFPVPTESALERDYFMTGSWLLPWSPRRPTESCPQPRKLWSLVSLMAYWKGDQSSMPKVPNAENNISKKTS